MWDDVIADVGGRGVQAPSIGQLQNVEDDEYEEEDESYTLQQPMLHGRSESDGGQNQGQWVAGVEGEGEGEDDEDVEWGDELQAAIEASAMEAVFGGSEARGGQGATQGGGEGV